VQNLLGLIPGMLPPTDNLNTTFACGIIVFIWSFTELGTPLMLASTGMAWIFGGPLGAIAFDGSTGRAPIGPVIVGVPSCSPRSFFSTWPSMNRSGSRPVSSRLLPDVV